MKDFIITTDSNSDLPSSYLEQHGIEVISHYYEIDGELYGEDHILSDSEFYNRMRNGSMPVTMASNPEVIHRVFMKYVNQGKEILHISFSSELSGGCSNVTMGAREICEDHKDAKIIVFDTLNVSLGQGLMIKKAVELREQGKDIDEVSVWLEQYKMNFCVQFTVDDLHHLHRGGRVSKATAVVGTLIQVKPILYVSEEGKLISLSNIRGRKKALNAIVENMMERIGRFREGCPDIGILHGDCELDARFVEFMVREKIPSANIILNTVSPSIGAHSGPGAVGVCFMGEIR